ncbi:MAG: hypothetical protein ACR2NT_05660 [Acidimicrobiia bacterium]
MRCDLPDREDGAQAAVAPTLHSVPGVVMLAAKLFAANGGFVTVNDGLAFAAQLARYLNPSRTSEHAVLQTDLRLARGGVPTARRLTSCVPREHG